MDPIIQKLQEQMLANMAAGRQIPPPPPPPSAYREQMLNEMMPDKGRAPLGDMLGLGRRGSPLDQMGVPSEIVSPLAAAAELMNDPLGAYVKDMRDALPPVTDRGRGSMDTMLQRGVSMAPDFIREAARMSDPETGMPNVDLGAGPIFGMAKKAVKAAKAAKATKAADIADDYINFSKMGLSDEGEGLLRGLIRRYADAPEGIPGKLPNPKEVLPDSAVRAQANKIDPESLFLLEPPKKGSGGLNEATSLALRDSIKGRISDLQKWTDEAANAADDATKTIAQARAAQVENDIAKLVQIQTGARAEAGRGLRVWRQMAEETTEPSFWLARAADKTGGKLPGDKALELQGILKQIEGAADDEAKSLGKLRLAKWMHSFEQHGIVDVALAWRKAGLVSGLKSHARNIGGNLGFGALREVSQLPEWITDSAFSLFSKQSTIAPPGINIHRGMHAAATKGVKQAAEVIKYGNTLEAAQKFDLGYPELNSTVFGGGKADKAINAWVNYNFRALGAEDKLFRSYAMQRALDDGAYAMARTMKMQGKLPAGTSVSEYAKTISANPPKELTANAMYAADYAVFANKNKLASWINSGKSQGDAMKVGLDLVMPYVTTPTNIIARLFEYTPAGAVVNSSVAAKNIFTKGFDAAQQKALSEAIGRGATGSALIYMGWKLAENDMMTGQPSDVAGERGVQMAAGRQPMSIKTGDEWRRINEFAPEAPLLIMGATMYENSVRPLSEESRRPDKLVGQTLKSFEEMPLTQGVEILNRAMEDPSSALKGYAREQIGTMIPTIVADAARATDDTVRTTYLKGSGIMDSAKERLPYFRKSLPALQDVYGERIKSEPIHAIDPTLPRTESSDKTRSEVAKAGASITKPRQRIGESNKDYLLRSEIQGRLIYLGLSQLTKAPQWEQMNEEQRRAAVAYVRSQVGRELSGATPELLKQIKEKMQ